MGDGLTHFRHNPGNLRHILADFLHDCGVRPLHLPRDDFDFALVHAGGVFIQFGAAGATRCRYDLWSAM